MKLPLPALTRLQGAPGYRTARRPGRRWARPEAVIARQLTRSILGWMLTIAVHLAAIGVCIVIVQRLAPGAPVLAVLLMLGIAAGAILFSIVFMQTITRNPRRDEGPPGPGS